MRCAILPIALFLSFMAGCQPSSQEDRGLTYALRPPDLKELARRRAAQRKPQPERPITSAYFPPVDAPSPPPAAPRLNMSALVTLGRSYGFRVDTNDLSFPVPTYHGAIAGRAASPEELALYMPLLVEEFNRYPREVVRAAGLKRVVLCKDLGFAGQPRNAVPDFEHQTLYLEVVRGIYDKRYMRGVIHHDFFHMIDWKDDGVLYDDPAWKLLNAAEFHYGAGGAAAQNDPEQSVLDPHLQGFLNRYSMTGVEEDKAEVFCYLMIDAPMLEARARRDAVLAAKLRHLKHMLHDFCPQIDAQFWARQAAAPAR